MAEETFKVFPVTSQLVQLSKSQPVNTPFESVNVASYFFVEALYNNQGENKNNKGTENEQFEKDLMVNLHNVNMRRTMSQESTKKTQKSLIEQIDNPEKEFQSHNKRILFPSDRNHFKENIDENVVHNLKDKVPLI